MEGYVAASRLQLHLFVLLSSWVTYGPLHKKELENVLFLRRLHAVNSSDCRGRETNSCQRVMSHVHLAVKMTYCGSCRTTLSPRGIYYLSVMDHDNPFDSRFKRLIAPLISPG